MSFEPVEKLLTNWGQFPVRVARSYEFSDKYQLKRIWPQLRSGFIARGMGRCYGDASLASKVLSTRQYEHFLDFDEARGILVAESGMTLKKLLTTLVPLGWFLPVTPGTSLITLGGALAADVHGKNHHCEGSFGEFIDWFDLTLPQGDTVRCSKYSNQDLFYATIGGMGLTGVIQNVALKLLPIETSWLDQGIDIAFNLKQLMDLFDLRESCRYSVAWIDCLDGQNPGRGVLLTGRHLELDEIRQMECKSLQFNSDPRFKIPFNMPGWLLGSWSVRRFNQMYAAIKAFSGDRGIVSLESYFYPLDTIGNWNFMYGSNGFIQYQCVIPLQTSYDGLTEIFKKIQKSGEGSFLAVLKKFGPSKSGGWLSFPMEGYTLALDFARRSGTEKLLRCVDEIVAQAGGRLYLAKDSRGPRDLYELSYPEWSKFAEFRKKLDPERILQSDLSLRLGL